MRPGRLLSVSTITESRPVVIPFRWLFYATLDGCYPAETRLQRVNRGNYPAHSRARVTCESMAVSLPFWSSLLSCVGLFMMTMGPSHLRPLIGFDQQLILVARLSMFPEQDSGKIAFFPASRTLVPVATVGEELSASSLAGWESRPTSDHQLSNCFATHPPSCDGFA